MNNVEAKFILQGYRPNGADAADAMFCAVLEQARHDPALHDWFAREQAFDAAISAKLNQIQAPAGLREAILAGGRVTASETPRRGWWQRPVMMAAAASIALIFAVTAALWPRQAGANTPLFNFALADAMHSEIHGGHGREAGALQALLSEPTTRMGGSLPVDFAALRAAGCRAVGFEGHDVLEVCFKRNGVWFHCYIVRREDFPTLAAVATPTLVDKSGIGIASWTDTAHLFVVVSKKGHSELEKLL
jgi:hypothetical protein